MEEVAVLDPIFNGAPHAAAVLERFAERGFKGRLSLQCRAEVIDASFLDVAAGLDVKLEFGLQTIHSAEGEAVRRKNHIDRVDRALADVRRRGIDHEVSLIFGLPLQTPASFEESVGWCLDRRVPVIKAFPLMLLRGTDLERERKRWDLVESGGEMPMVVASNSFDEQDWQHMARISEALCLTEGRHPAGIEELRCLARDLAPTVQRWRPEPEESPDHLASGAKPSLSGSVSTAGSSSSG